MVQGLMHRNTRYRTAYPLTTQRATCGIRLLAFADAAMVAVLETQPDDLFFCTLVYAQLI